MMRRMVLTQEDAPGLRDAIEDGYRAGSGCVVYRGVAMNHRPAHHIFEALCAGEEEVGILYEDWQIMGAEARRGEEVEVSGA